MMHGPMMDGAHGTMMTISMIVGGGLLVALLVLVVTTIVWMAPRVTTGRRTDRADEVISRG